MTQNILWFYECKNQKFFWACLMLTAGDACESSAQILFPHSVIYMFLSQKGEFF